MKPFVADLGIACLAAVAALLGVRGAMSGVEARVPEVVVEAGPRAPCETAPAVARLIARSEAANRALQEIESQRDELFGPAQGFADTPPPLRPDALEATLRAILEGFDAEILAKDCLESPCVVAVEVEDIDDAANAFEVISASLPEVASAPQSIYQVPGRPGRLIVSLAGGQLDDAHARRTTERVAALERMVEQ